MKLGGSVLTDKAAYATPRSDDIRRLAREVASVLEASPTAGPLILVHGAGSFGHTLARQHKLKDGDDGNGDRRLAFARVHADVRALQALVLHSLRDAGVPAVSHSTYDLARLDRGELATFAHAAIGDTLRAGLVPVLGGDGALDASRGFGILSGDTLMVELARAYRPKVAIFATDVDGIFDRFPEGRLLPRVDAGTRLAAGEARGADVTGGMGGKLARARDVAATGVPVRVMNGAVAGRLADALAGRDVLGTLVLP